MPISKVAIKKILKESGAERISDPAAMELTDIINKFAYSLSKKAVSLAAHAKRKTIKRSDVDLAKK